MLPDADAVICISREEQRQLQQRHPHTRVEHIPWGVDVDHFDHGDGAAWRAERRVPETTKLLVCVGRIDAQKNQLSLVEALPEIRQQCGDVRIALVGPVTNPEYLARIETTRRALGVEPWVDLVGGLPARSSELAGAYAAADCFVIPSRHEPFGVVVLEAWAAHRPVVASAVGGMSDLVDDGDNGVLIRDPAGPAEIARALIPTLKSNRKLQSLADSGHAAVRPYTWEATIRRHLALYDELRRN